MFCYNILLIFHCLNNINEKSNNSNLKNLVSKSSGNVLTNASSKSQNGNIIQKNKNIKNKKLKIYTNPFKENDYHIFDYLFSGF